MGEANGQTYHWGETMDIMKRETTLLWKASKLWNILLSSLYDHLNCKIWKRVIIGIGVKCLHVIVYTNLVKVIWCT
jgi:hypothetical protein